MEATDFLRASRLRIWEGTYSVLQVHAIPEDFVAAVRAPREMTVVHRTGATAPELIRREEKGWKIITFDAELPFELTGFLAAITRILAQREVPVFALSAFSTDHLLIREAHLEAALRALVELGCLLEMEE